MIRRPSAWKCIKIKDPKFPWEHPRLFIKNCELTVVEAARLRDWLDRFVTWSNQLKREHLEGKG